MRDFDTAPRRVYPSMKEAATLLHALRPLLTALSIVVGLAASGHAQRAFRPPAVPLVTHHPCFSI